MKESKEQQDIGIRTDIFEMTPIPQETIPGTDK